MPRDPFKPLLEDEQRFVYHYLRLGAVPEKAYLAEQKAKLPKGTGAKMLKRRHVIDEIDRRKALVEFEEHKIIARDKAKLAAEEDARHSVTLDKLEKALDGVISLDAKEHGTVVLEAIRLGLVYTGTIRNGNMVRLVVEDPNKTKDTPEDQNPSGSFYRSIFNAMPQGDIRAEAHPLLPDIMPAVLDPTAPLPPPPVLKTDPEPPPPPPVKKPAGKSKLNTAEITFT
jgi:hypothetical protein